MFRLHLLLALVMGEVRDLFEGIGLCLCLTIRLSRTWRRATAVSMPSNSCRASAGGSCNATAMRAMIGRLELDTKPVENAIRPIWLSRKNTLFGRHEVGAEIGHCSRPSPQTCKLKDVNPVAYIAETLTAVLDGHPHSAIEDLDAMRFRKASPNP